MPSLYGPTGYISLPSVEITPRGTKNYYAHNFNLQSPDFNLNFNSIGITAGIRDNLEVNLDYLQLNFDSPRELGYFRKPTVLQGEAMLLNLKYRIYKPRDPEKNEYDAMTVVGLVLPVDTFDDFKIAVKNVLNVVKESIAEDPGKPTGYLCYGGGTFDGSRCCSLFFKYGDSFSLGGGFKSRLRKNMDLVAEYEGCLYNLRSYRIDKTNYGVGIRFTTGKNIHFQIALSRMEVEFTGGKLEQNFRETFDYLNLGIICVY